MTHQSRALLLLVLMIAGLAAILLAPLGLFTRSNLHDISSAWFFAGDDAVHTTVIYVYRGDDELYPDNLNYFLRHGVREGDGNRYYVVLPQSIQEEKDRGTVAARKDDSFRWCTCTHGCPTNKNKGKDQDSPYSSDTQRRHQQWISSYFGGRWFRTWSKSINIDDDGCACKCPKDMTTMALPRNVILAYHEVLGSSRSSGSSTIKSNGYSGSSNVISNASSTYVMDMVSTLSELMSGESDGHQLPRSSQYYLLLDSTVRGPFLPLYLSNYDDTGTGTTPPTTSKDKEGVEGGTGTGGGSIASSSSLSCFHPYRWTDAFTAKITPTVKLVGSTIACSPSPHLVCHHQL